MLAHETVESVSGVERSVKPEKRSWLAIGIDLTHLCGLDRWPGRLWHEPWFVVLILSTVPFWGYQWWLIQTAQEFGTTNKLFVFSLWLSDNR